MRRTPLMLLVAVFLVAGCGGGGSSPSRAPSSPSPLGQAPTSSLAVGVGFPVAPAAVPWHCLTASAAFPPSDCLRLAGLRARQPLRVGAEASAPGVPTNFAASVSGNRVTLTWQLSSVSTEVSTSFVIEAGSSPGQSDLANFDTASPTPALTVDDVPAGTYYVRVRAKNSAGLSAASSEVIVTVAGPTACTSAPGAPTTLTQSVSGTSVTLTWTAPVGGCAPTAYILEAGSAADLANLVNTSTRNTTTSYSAAGVAVGTYYVRVRSANSVGQSGPTNEVVVTVPSAAAPCPNRPTGTFTLNAGETIRMSFTTAPLPTADIMITTLGGVADNLSWTLSNGSVVLGSQSPFGSGPFWRSSSSLSGFPALVVDFSSIVNGTIDGRVEAKANRTLTLDLSQAIVSIGRGMSSGGANFFSQPPFTLTLISPSCH